jgi:hypothetical protein
MQGSVRIAPSHALDKPADDVVVLIAVLVVVCVLLVQLRRA